MIRYTHGMIAPLLAALLLAGCDRILPQRDTTLPDIDVVREVYGRHGVQAAEVRYSGNVVELVVQQDRAQLQRGGQLWARVGPYIYVFSPATRDLFETYEGLAGVRAITEADGQEVARVLLRPDALNEISWRRARSLLGEALEQGTQRPVTLDRLVQFGEQNTTFEYNPAYVPPR
jgi:hypothetical protein